MYEKEKVISIALSQVGYLEKSSTAVKTDPSVLYSFQNGAGSDNYTKYGKEMHEIYPKVMDYPAAWCDCFVDWCFLNAYGEARAKEMLGGDFDDYTVSSASMYKKKGRWFSNPQTGDQIFFKNDKRICHTGIVYKVENGKVFTVEGNTSDGSEVIANGGAVCKKSYDLTNGRIAGYGRPSYEDTGSNWSQLPDGDWVYKKENGLPATSEWLTINHHWYHFNESGVMDKGWKKIGGEWFYLEENNNEGFEGACWHESSKQNGALERWTV